MIIPAEGIWNFRDVGGMPAQRGDIRSGVLFRSATLTRATAADVTLVQERVDQIIDLRDSTETETDPSPAIGVETVRIPLLLGSAATLFEADTTFDDFYRRMLADSGDMLTQAARAIGQGADNPRRTLVHCTVGKDRTGVTIALVLAAVGARREDIVRDYALSQSQIPQTRNDFLAKYLRERYPQAKNAYALATLSPAPAIEKVLTGVEQEYGSGADFFRAHGLSEDELLALQDRLVKR